LQPYFTIHIQLTYWRPSLGRCLWHNQEHFLLDMISVISGSRVAL
jgi:hypothetical protein